MFLSLPLRGKIKTRVITRTKNIPCHIYHKDFKVLETTIRHQKSVLDSASLELVQLRAKAKHEAQTAKERDELRWPEDEARLFGTREKDTEPDYDEEAGP
jgi:hypothetical protein